MITKPLTVNVTISPDLDVEGTGAVQLYSETNDVIAALEDDETAKEVIDLLNFALEAKERTKIRQRTLAANQGPEKAIESTIKNFMKVRESVKKPVTYDEAKKLVMASLGLS